MSDKILITGGAGFIGSAFARLMAGKGAALTIIDKITYAGDLNRLKSIKGKYTFYRRDLAHKKGLLKIFKKERPKVVIHFAAESHVDRSIKDADPFVKSNIIGTQNLIDACLATKVKKLVHVSTDEIYGEGRRGKFRESSPLHPNNPYSASKAAAELLVKSAIRTYNLSAVIVRPCNNYGPWQYPEKLVPVVITNALAGRKVPVYGKGEHIREWLHVHDCVRAIQRVMAKGKRGETYNIGSGHNLKNLATVKTILKALDKPERLIRFVKDRPGHDVRYCVNANKIKALGWEPLIPFAEGIKETVKWYTDHAAWVKKCLAKI